MLEVLKVIGIISLIFIIVFILCACKVASYSSILENKSRLKEEDEKQE